ncbi:glycosyltransferase [Corallococcus sp. bb12-1]|uniref:glycosyltransferase n=1 Tax=Corallococcus sp. bb12-1 TaxID=2996784 RepID=UPI00226F4891|nr:glycosyltransferase [Corallococcus sp. bb12-1]MCY1047780.1 glycosyltransferase [Corallococcus sp. bb12-1]
MATILIAPYPSHGHVNPTLKLARSLRERGHRVLYAGPPDARELVLRAGFEFFPVLEAHLPVGSFDAFGAKGFMEHVRKLRAYTRRIDSALRGIGDGELDDLFERTKPDLVVCDCMLPYPALVAHGRDVPAVFFCGTIPREFIHPFLARPPTTFGRRMRAFVVGALLSLMALLGVAPRMRKHHARIARRYGYPVEQLPTEPEPILVRGLPELILAPREFAEPSGHMDSQYLYVGPSIDLDRPPTDFPWEKLAQDKPLVLFSLGGMGGYNRTLEQRVLETVFAAARARPQWQFVFAVNPTHEARDFEADNVVAVKHAPLLQLLGRASAVITHGGFNTVKECIHFGVPMVVIPLAFDQPAVARQVELRGLGVHCPPRELEVQGLLRHLDSLMTEPRWRATAEAMRARFHEADREAPIADAVEGLLRKPRAEDARLASADSGR